MDRKIELIPLAVTDVDRSVEFYGNRVGWTVDHDQTVHEGLRFVQVTPQGSACSFCCRGAGLGLVRALRGPRRQQVVAAAGPGCA